MKKISLFLVTILLIAMSAIPTMAKTKKTINTTKTVSVSNADKELKLLNTELDKANKSLMKKMRKLDKAEAKLAKTKKEYNKTKKAKFSKKKLNKKKIAYYKAKDNALIARQQVQRQRNSIKALEEKIQNYINAKNVSEEAECRKTA